MKIYLALTKYDLLIFTLTNHSQSSLDLNPDRVTIQTAENRISASTVKQSSKRTAKTARTLQTEKQPSHSTDYGKESLQQMKMWEKIPSEVRRDIGVHLGLCIDLS